MLLMKAKVMLQRQRGEVDLQAASVAVGKPTHLPKLELPFFSGEVVQWPAFWEAFESAVDGSELQDEVRHLERPAVGGDPAFSADLTLDEQSGMDEDLDPDKDLLQALVEQPGGTDLLNDLEDASGQPSVAPSSGLEAAAANIAFQ